MLGDVLDGLDDLADFVGGISKMFNTISIPSHQFNSPMISITLSTDGVTSCGVFISINSCGVFGVLFIWVLSLGYSCILTPFVGV